MVLITLDLMKDWERFFTRGKHLLTRHQPQKALECFNTAMKDCPVSCREDLRRILFFMGITFTKLGYQACALESFRAASRLGPNRHCEHVIKRMSNEYGMPKAENDDKRAFRMVQQCKYLSSRRQGRFGSPAEKDMILDLIDTAWIEFSQTNDLCGLSCQEKKELFAAEVIIFPYMETPSQWLKNPGEAKILKFDEKNSNFLFKKPCPCGSGKPFGLCCGNILSEDESRFGVF